MTASLFRSAVLTLARVGLAAAVMFMAGWNAYICLRLRPDLPTVFINLSFWFVPILALYALSGRLWRSLALGTTFTFMLQRLHWLKWRFLEQTWTAADFRLVADRTNWIVVQQYPEILVFLLLCLVVLVAAWFIAPRGMRASARARVVAGALVLIMVGGTIRSRHTHIFDPFGFNLYGHFASLVYSWSTLSYNPPVLEGSSALFTQRAAALASTEPIDPPQHPDIVIWLQESTMDPVLFHVPGASLPALSMYAPDAETRSAGLLRVHTWGGSTWLSEFALLGGLSHVDFGASGNGVYYTVVPKLRYSLPKLLKEYGYRSVAISGSPKGIYNMEVAQRAFGFDEVMNPLDFESWGGKSLADHLISDEQLGHYADEILGRKRDYPMLLFVLSIAQHGPYSSTHPVQFGLDHSQLDHGTAARLSDFTARMVDTNAANEHFSTRLLGRSRPVVFAYFGDHQPNIEAPIPYVDGFFEPQFLTSYAVKNNFEPVAAVATHDITSATQKPPVLDIAYLGGVILEHAGIPLGPLFSANRSMRLLCDGRLADCPDQELTKSYRAFLYQDLKAAARE